MLRPGLPTLLRRACTGLFAAVAILAGLAQSRAQPRADGLQPAVTAQAAKAAIADVLAMSGPADSLLAGALQAAGVVALLAGLIVLALLLRRRAAVRRPARYWALPAFRPDTAALQEAEALWLHSPVLAVGRLYRGLLARLATDYQLTVPEGDTEPELVRRVATLRLSGLDDFTRRLAAHWERSRYGGKAPSDAEWAALCAGWRRLFPAEVRA